MALNGSQRQVRTELGGRYNLKRAKGHELQPHASPALWASPCVSFQTPTLWLFLPIPSPLGHNLSELPSRITPSFNKERHGGLEKGLPAVTSPVSGKICPSVLPSNPAPYWLSGQHTQHPPPPPSFSRYCFSGFRVCLRLIYLNFSSNSYCLVGVGPGVAQ